MSADISIVLGIIFIWSCTIAVPMMLGKQQPDWMLRQLTPAQRRGALAVAVIGVLALMGFSGVWFGV
ncbi:MAG TPA: hypothetical protein VGE07_07110 [Herpetosiphonaceae bacterium]